MPRILLSQTRGVVLIEPQDGNIKLERDLIRNRDWDYSAPAFGVPEYKREELRKDIIKHHGKKLELIAPNKKKQKKKKPKKKEL